jgi:hypothetical protein
MGGVEWGISMVGFLVIKKSIDYGRGKKKKKKKKRATQDKLGI